MLKKFASGAVHLVFFAMVVAIAGYWSIRIFTPAPTSAPPPLPPPPLRDPDPSAAARMFGKVDMPVAVATNVQALGVFVAGRDSSAVLVVDSKPPRVFLLGQDVAPGMKLAEVNANTVILDSSGSRLEVRLPVRPLVAFGGAPPPANFVREGNTLTAPSTGVVPRSPMPAATPTTGAPNPPPAPPPATNPQPQ